MPATKAIPPRTAHRVCQDIKLPGNILIPCKTQTPPKNTSRAPMMFSAIFMFSSWLSPQKLREPQRLRRIYLGHDVDIRLGNSFLAQRLEKQDQSVGMRRGSYLAGSGWKNTGNRGHPAHRFGGNGARQLFGRSQRAGINKIHERARAP